MKTIEKCSPRFVITLLGTFNERKCKRENGLTFVDLTINGISDSNILSTLVACGPNALFTPSTLVKGGPKALLILQPGLKAGQKHFYSFNLG